MEGVFIACWCRTDVRPAVSMRFTYGHLIQELVSVRVTWSFKDIFSFSYDKFISNLLRRLHTSRVILNDLL